MSTVLSAPRSRIQRALQYVSDLWQRREFAIYLGFGNLKARNASTVFGVMWWALNPLLLGGVYYLVFGVIFFSSNRPPDFLAYLLSGMFVFHFTSQSMTGGANAILQNSKLLANLRFPRLILPIANLIESAVGFIVSLLVFYAVALPMGQTTLNYRILFLPFALVIHVFFNLGLAALMARLAVPFRDINNLVPYVNRVWLYLTPIIWPLSALDGMSDQMLFFVKLNPMFHIVALYRSMLFGTTFVMSDIVWSVGYALAVGVIGIAVFVKYEGHIVRYL